MTLTFQEFHHALRILRGIDRHEFLTAIYGAPLPADGSEQRNWEQFRKGPWQWFLVAGTDHAEAIWAVVRARHDTAGPPALQSPRAAE